ncbi:MAG TPA: non-homologous end-joining DNA ligase [Streptosporangiaceae bacterium]
MADTAAREQLRVGRQTVPLSNTGKVLFPADGITKGDLVHYYRDIAEVLLPYLRERPLSLARYPEGLSGERIFQKNVGRHFPDWIPRAEVDKAGGELCQVLAEKPADLVYLANQASIELHAVLSRTGSLHQPDQLIFDLDPPDEDRFGDVRTVALRLRGILADDLGLTAFVKTTGSKGLHVLVPLNSQEDFDPVREFARQVAEVLVRAEPDLVTLEPRKAARGDRIYADIMRNGYAQTAVAPYSVRARPGAPVAVPLHWDEVADPGLSPRGVTIRTISARLDELASSGDPWAGMARHRHGLARPRRLLSGLT